MVRLLCAKPVRSETKDLLVEVILGRSVVHQIAHMNDTGADGLAIRGHRIALAGLDELHLIAFRIFRLKPAASILAASKLAQALNTTPLEISQQSGCILRVICNASHAADAVVSR